MYRVTWSQAALEALDTIPLNVADLILRKVEEHLAKSPQQIGKPLRSNLKGLYSYRIGNYRIIYKTEDEKLEILVIKIGHRKDVYEL